MNNTCTVVRGCERPHAIKNFVHKGRTYRICGMHRARFLRTGNFGGPEPQSIGTSETAGVSRNTKKSAKALGELRRKYGELVELTPLRGSYAVKGGRARFSCTQVTSWRRRGWVRLNRLANGETTLRILDKGHRAIPEGA